MESYLASEYKPCFKVGPLHSAAASTVSTATGSDVNSCTGSTLVSEPGTRRPEDALGYYAQYAAWQAAAAYHRDALLEQAKLSVSSESDSVQTQAVMNGDDSVSVVQSTVSGDDSVSVAQAAPLKLGAKRVDNGTSRRHWILPPKVDARQPKEAGKPTLSSRPEPHGSAPENKPQNGAWTRHWMLAPRKAQEQDRPDSKAGSRRNSSTEEDACLGTWCYPSAMYKVSRASAGGLYFETTLPSGRTITGQLKPRDEYFQGEVFRDATEHVGTIRLRTGVDAGTLVSNFHPGSTGEIKEGLAAMAAGKADWGPDVIATKKEEVSNAQQPEVEPLQERHSLPVGKLFNWRGGLTICSANNVPVKHTFIQFDDRPEERRLPLSSPAILTSGPFMLQPDKTAQTIESAEAQLPATSPVVMQAHSSGDCKPCAYFWGKQDGCRSGDGCRFCHLCQPGELKRRRREKDRTLRQQQRAQKKAGEEMTELQKEPQNPPDQSHRIALPP